MELINKFSNFTYFGIFMDAFTNEKNEIKNAHYFPLRSISEKIILILQKA